MDMFKVLLGNYAYYVYHILVPKAGESGVRHPAKSCCEARKFKYNLILCSLVANGHKLVLKTNNIIVNVELNNK